ncbi:MAG: hypothetical protein U0821_18725 [Chloroflexota bacterium]
MNDLDLSTLNPGIRQVVKMLREWGYETVDSGDGATREFECDRDHPYVVIKLAQDANPLDETDRLLDSLRDVGVYVDQIGNPDGHPWIQQSYDPVTDIALIELDYLDDAGLRRAVENRVPSPVPPGKQVTYGTATVVSSGQHPPLVIEDEGDES